MGFLRQYLYTDFTLKRYFRYIKLNNIVIKINLPLSFYFFLNVVSTEFSFPCVGRIVFLLDSAALEVALPEVRAETLDARMPAP